ncbi:MAG: hypothetical protein COW59_07555 [Lysobacterales bacterium CG17_big_fil_post_rev_8_21_14_2_50_64_11]|nr:MAG: hypothetical protein COW59_07555 [Xanthomonadales bacterium CG17_big_fil_post_rev_8_21_14_2_50_64_11]PIX60728.1 MAG: hypothetical protein COZ47_05725 [Xanthomonadales bacterium CG_4_10_14_3_um_filter_64_11]
MSSHERVKVGGWLTLFCVLLTIIFPLAALGGMSNAIDLSKPGSGIDQYVAGALSINAFTGFVFGVYSFFCGLTIWRGSRDGKREAYTYLIIYPIAFLFVNSFLLLRLEDINGLGVVQVQFALISDIFSKILFSLVWILYFRFSKRIKHTYG